MAADCVAVKGNAKVLLISIALFGTITTIQFFFALASHSDALLVDCASMLVDTLTYVGNLYSECRQKSTAMSPAEKARFSLATSALSLAVLFTITGWGLSDAIGTITAKNVEDDLDGAVVVASVIPEPVEPRKRDFERNAFVGSASSASSSISAPSTPSASTATRPRATAATRSRSTSARPR